VVDVIHLGPRAEADQLLAPLRALRPATDTIQTTPVQALSHLHMDPEHPVPDVGDGLLLASLPREAVHELIRVTSSGPAAQLLAVELRHISGELKRARPGSGALAALDADYALFAGGLAGTPEAAATAASGVTAVQSAMAPGPRARCT
jgi:hypothetical protein